MKFATLTLFFASTAAFAFAQPQLPSIDLTATPNSQAGCPVQFLHAAFTRPARYMPIAADADAPVGSLSLDYRNASGKEIAQIDIQAEMLIKRSIYDLDSTPVGIHMTLSGPALARGEQRSQSLPVGGNIVGYKATRLTRILYTDGTEWRAASQQLCELTGTNDLRGIAK